MSDVQSDGIEDDEMNKLLFELSQRYESVETTTKWILKQANVRG